MANSIGNHDFIGNSTWFGKDILKVYTLLRGSRGLAVAVSAAIAVVISVPVMIMGCRGDDGMRSTSHTQFVVVLLVVLPRRRLRIINGIGEGGGYKVKHGIQLV